MKPSLQLRIGQHLTMTPQLQQAIRLLQLSSLDLQQEIQQALYDNPMLELTEEEEYKSPQQDNRTEDTNPQVKPESQASTTDTGSDEQWTGEIPDDLPIDAQWDDIFHTPSSHGSISSGNSSTESRNFDTFEIVTDSLQDHLLWQLNLTPMSDQDRRIGTAIIDAIEPSGFLGMPVEDIWQGLLRDNNDDVELDEVEAVLHRIQHFDPTGIGSRSLRECLLIQLAQLHQSTPLLGEARDLVENHLELVGSRDYKQLMRKTGLLNGTLDQAISLIQTLNPKPGELIRNSNVEYVVPDVRVVKRDGRWQVSLNNDITSNIRINQTYSRMIQRADSSEQNRFLREHLQEARSFIRSLESRNETLLRVAACIVEMQLGFLEQGPEAMRPMVLADVAQQLELHESTVSRVTTQKYIDTPRGVYELKYFFSSHVNTSAGGQCSSTAIRAMLKKMIGEENSSKPLSDNKLAAILADQGIQVARRTVAKYRESLNIPSSSERKRYKRS